MNQATEKIRNKAIKDTTPRQYLIKLYCYLLKSLDFFILNDLNKILNDPSQFVQTNINEIIIHTTAGNADSWEQAKKQFSFLDIEKSRNEDLLKITDLMLLEFINICLGIIKDINVKIYWNINYKLKNSYNGFKYLIFQNEKTKLIINELLEISENFLFFYDKSEYMLFPSEQKILLENINNSTFSEMVYLYKGSKTFLEKENNFSAIAKKCFFLFNKNDKKYRDLFLKYFNKEKLDNLSRECNGYFRHSVTDPGDKEKSSEWDSFDENKRIEIMNETFSVYLFILSLLRDNNLIDEFVSSLNNN